MTIDATITPSMNQFFNFEFKSDKFKNNKSLIVPNANVIN